MPLNMRSSAHLIAPVLMAISTLAIADTHIIDNSQFVNWESPHVHPIDKTESGRRLLAVNTADNRLEVFSIEGGDSLNPVRIASIPVGLDPVTVRVRNENEAWVVNRISDSVSIVNLELMNVVATLSTLDEPADVIFNLPGDKAFVSCAQANTVQVFSPDDPTSPPVNIKIEGLRPSGMALGLDGQTLYVAILESGNGTTLLNGGNFALPPQGGSLGIPDVVNNSAGPHLGANPPFNGPGGVGFAPALNINNNPIGVSLIVRQDADGKWTDDTGANWTEFVSGVNANASGRIQGWKLLDHDIALINTNDLGVTRYARRAMTMCMAIGVHPQSGRIVMVGTEAHNERRFEPNLQGKFIDVNFALVSADGNVDTITNLNPQVINTPAVVNEADFRTQAIGDPRAVIFSADGAQGFVAGMGSNNILLIDEHGNRLADPIRVREGPTGLALLDAERLLYVLNRFDASISVVSTVQLTEVKNVPLYDPSPGVIKRGRKHLYDTHHSSSNGHVSCASCHVDARFDRLAWDLGDPALGMDAHSMDDQNLGAGMPGLAPSQPGSQLPFEPFTQMKGPMTTQTFQDIIGKEPHHWRGDRDGIEAFNPTFEALLGNDQQLSPDEMQQFEDFLATINFPPNPFRTIFNQLPTNLPLDGHFSTGQFFPTNGAAAGAPLPNGNASNGLFLFTQVLDICHGSFSCVQCHSLPTGLGTDFKWNGSSFDQLPPGPNGEHHRSLVAAFDFQTNSVLKTPHLRNQYQKIGCNYTQPRNIAGFGYNHDGSVDSLERFIGLGFFQIGSDQRVADLTAFLLAFSGSDLPGGSLNTLENPPGGVSHDTHAAVGRQTTITDFSIADPAQLALIADMIALGNSGRVGLIAKSVRDNRPRGWAFIGNNTFLPDRQIDPSISADDLLASATPGQELTLTIVVRGTPTRIGIDHDLDGILDADDLVDGPNPCPADFNLSGQVTVQDIFDFLAAYFTNALAADINASGTITVQDIFDYLALYFAGCT